jgi:HEAT repeat protein
MTCTTLRIVPLTMFALLVGCGLQTTAPAMDPRERADLETRALNQLLTAADNPLVDVRCNAIEALVRVAPRDALIKYREAAGADQPMVRYAGLAAIGEVRDRAALQLATSAVNDESPFVRMAGAFAATRLGKSGYVRILLDQLRGEAPENQRVDAALLLGRLDEQRARPWLKAAIRHGANERARSVQLAIHAALARLGDKDSLQELIRYAQGDAATRTEALLLLADLGNRDSADALRYRLLSAHEEYVEPRLIAARGLGRIGFQDGYDLAMQHVSFTDPNLRPTPDNPSRTYPVRSMAIHALAEIGDPRALPILRQVAASSDDARLQVAASYAILRILRQ